MWECVCENVCMCARRAQVYSFENTTEKALALIAAKLNKLRKLDLLTKLSQGITLLKYQLLWPGLEQTCLCGWTGRAWASLRPLRTFIWPRWSIFRGLFWTEETSSEHWNAGSEHQRMEPPVLFSCLVWQGFCIKVFSSLCHQWKRFSVVPVQCGFYTPA